MREHPGRRAPGWREELARFARARPAGAKLFVSTVAAPPDWREVGALEGDELALVTGERIPLQSSAAFVVAYASGEIVASHPAPPRSLPQGAHFVARVDAASSDTLSDADVAASDGCVVVTFGPVRRSPTRGKVYETTVTNRCAGPVRITGFGAYRRDGDGWKLNTITGGFFTAEQFRDWYGVAGDGQLAPGASGVDRENYGPDALWVFFFETPDGKPGRAIGRGPA